MGLLHAVRHGVILESRKEYQTYIMGKMKFAFRVAIACSIVLCLVLIDLTSFAWSGKFVLHPVLNLLIAFAALGLTLVACVSFKTGLKYLMRTLDDDNI